ncbi:MAG: hypothetical protein IKX27_05215 [Oscillospiraceae bacterium]|nr:hypothetical protein [Oscillospiraceae bacterium]
MTVMSAVFGVLTVLLSDVMCAVVAFNYCDMLWGIRYAGYSAPANVAFLTAVPYIIGIIVCIILALFFRRKTV